MRPITWMRRQCRLGSLSMNTCVAIVLYITLLVTCANYITASLASPKLATAHTETNAQRQLKEMGKKKNWMKEAVENDVEKDERRAQERQREANRDLQRRQDEEERQRRQMERKAAQADRLIREEEAKQNSNVVRHGQAQVRDVANRRNNVEESVEETMPPKPTRPPTAGGYVAQQRIVHFDLKGAPPKVDYLLRLIPLIASAGATGIIIEWEDTFPYNDEILARGVRGNPYRIEAVHDILKMAKSHNLTVIPLVQTFGHLEWLLKVEGNEIYRDNPINSQVICAAQDAAFKVLTTMVDEIAAVHAEYGMPYVHIGCDEVYEVGTCPESRQKLSHLGGKDQYMVWHMSRLATYIKETHRSKTLIWHDMIINMDIPSLAAKYNFTTLVEPVIWYYAENLDMYLPQYVWDVFADFENVWSASAYKGADGPMRNVIHYVRNHQSWVKQMTGNAARMKNFRGIMLSGWSRYDHFAILTELLPVAIPSLLMSLQVVKRGIGQSTRETVTEQYADLLPLVQCDMNPNWNAHNPGGGCVFPGESIYQQVQRLRAAREELRQSLWSDTDPGFDYNGWLGRMNTVHSYSSHYRTAQLLPMVEQHLQTFKNIHDSLKRDLSAIYSDDVVTEWIYEYVWPDYGRLLEVDRAGRKAHTTKTFVKRPLDYSVEKAEMAKLLSPSDEL